MGSSPLARGLLHHYGRVVPRSGIIPARAGFTPGRHCSSAGVLGSSPLARGLQPRPRTRGDKKGIIPARAGFTTTSTRGIRRPGDHPRSRGVYLTHDRSPPHWAGSSPLARGLLVSSTTPSRSARIIPARAGFTAIRRPRSLWTWDHPRSRGVYLPEIPLFVTFSGSSPLARGLRSWWSPFWGLARIIPARAGFTPHHGSHECDGTDHPRSRGVYRLRLRIVAAARGSSPLARGLRRLQHFGRLSRRGRRIIPARAGFTRPSDAQVWRLTDHPRSRGVYNLFQTYDQPRTGSSPLARGLHLRILGIPTNPYSTRPLLPSLPT